MFKFKQRSGTSKPKPRSNIDMNPKLYAFKIAAVFFISSVLWIVFTDYLVSFFIKDSRKLFYISVFKGIIYVSVIITIVFFMVYRGLMRYKKVAVDLAALNNKLSESRRQIIQNKWSLRKESRLIKKQKAELEKSRKLYDLAIEGTQSGIWSYDFKTKSFFFTIKSKPIMGYSETDFDKDEIKNFEKMLHPDDRERVMASWKQENMLQNTEEAVFRMITKDGKTRWIMSRGHTYSDENGLPTMMAGIHSDITEYLELTESLRLEKELTDGILNNASSIIIVTDMEGNIELISKYAEKLTGYASKDKLDYSFIEAAFCPEDRENVRNLFDKLKQGIEQHTSDFRFICKDGRVINVLWNFSFLYDAEAKVRRIIIVGTDVTELKDMSKKLYQLAYTDQVTGLPNRAMIQKEFAGFVKNDSGGLMAALLYIDIDNFKHINDILGHKHGDLLLYEVARKLNDSIKEPKIISSFGADDFVILMSGRKGIADIECEVKNILNSLSGQYELGGQQYYITFSIGISLYPKDSCDLSELLRYAGTAMYVVKDEGKNSYAFYNKSMDEKISVLINTVNGIRNALQKGEFTLYYQPLINLSTNRIEGVEALIRWRRHGDKVISPNEFISVAEQAGIISYIDYWVIDKAIEQKAEWDSKGLKNLIMSINLSGKTLTDNSLAARIKKSLDKYSVAPSEVQIEITETAFLSDISAAVEVLGSLRRMGVRVVLDDFGKGYSSLNYLNTLPIVSIKLDKDFIGSMQTNKSDRYIVKTIIELAHALNMTVIGEGIETSEQLKFLKENKCDMGQGYLFSKPKPVGFIEEFLVSEKIECEGGQASAAPPYMK